MRKLLFVVGFLIIGYIGWVGYHYFFDQSVPQIELVGLKDYASGDVSCIIKGRDKYKIKSLAVWLDNKELIVEEKVGKSVCERPLIIATSQLTNEPHALRIKMIDGTYHRNGATKEINFTVDNTPLQAALIRPESDFKVSQGHTFHVPFQCNKRIKKASIKVLSREFLAVPESDYETIYECFVPIDCEEMPGEQPFIVDLEDFVGNRLTLNGKVQIASFPFKKQIIRKVDEDQFAEERRLGRSEKEFYDLLQEVTAQSPAKKLWRGPFFVPLNLTSITCEFGVKRISQERGCYRHAALDVIGLPKTVIWAPQDGVVKIKDRFGVTGNTVLIDHGCGVLSILCHLDRFADIEVGDKIRRGKPVGIMGKTGYATGDHLHWEMRVNNICVDPLEWTKRDF
ncbi:MAG: Metalloendopeptidase-like protein membrane protein [candidate division TM6 bacterium GW2011_GWE2_36_25]|nr:MAG: Metalloendopeptidase-like protein membrane protein [candidate division TM6 bacterium GW2011_GWF2_36_131]KKQ03741.1 MAG: Metalloendopeptidase-like protein membrane protein [candidate division TM6 bacterium GW2011_GWE2_36_25]